MMHIVVNDSGYKPCKLFGLSKTCYIFAKNTIIQIISLYLSHSTTYIYKINANIKSKALFSQLKDLYLH